MIFPPEDYWIQLWRESRGNIIGGIVATVFLGAVAFFWKSILGALRRLFDRPSSPAVQAAPQEVILKVETVQPALPPSLVPTAAVRDIPKSHIPRPPIAGFVARRDDNGRDIVERLKVELSPEKEQLIVLWGAGGVGKTTLAAKTARVMRELFEGGIIWTSADGKSDFSLSTLLDEIATHLERSDLRQLAPRPKDEEVHLALSRAQNTLIVLDNFETISPEEQEKCAAWLANRASCPALITSRDEVPHARPIHILAMSLSEAREFLQKLISDARNPRAFEHLNHDQVIEAADRIPLVLQWLVKRIDSAKQPQAVLDELSHGEGDAAKRIFDRSFDLAQVGDDGRATLLALSLFNPSASRVALAEVAGFGKEIERLERAVQQLSELWLMQTTERNERVRVEGLTRELARAHFEKDEGATDYRRRFVAYFRTYAKSHDKPTSQNYDDLETEKDNLLNAMRMAFALGDWENLYALGYIIADPVGGMLSVRGYWAEVLKANQQALEVARQSNSELDVACFAHNLAVMYGNRGELTEAQELYNESLQILRKLGNQRNVATSLHQLAWLAHLQRKLVEAQQLYNESLEIYRKLGDQSSIADTLHQLAWLAHDQGKSAEARPLYNESLEIKRKLSDAPGIARSLHHLAMLAYDQRELAEARRLCNESLEMKRKLGDQNGIAITLHQLALTAEAEGDRKEAARLYGEALAIFERLKSPNANRAQRDLKRVGGKAHSVNRSD